jgi:hypothetical protein
VPLAFIWGSSEKEDFECHNGVTESHSVSVTSCTLSLWPFYTVLVSHVMCVTLVTCVTNVTHTLVLQPLLLNRGGKKVFK